jgi:hypothetical protein
MSFPSSPSNGQTATVNGISYQYNSTTNAWTRQLTQTGEKTTTSTTPPVNPGPGDAWYNPTTDVILTYMYDGANWWWIDRDGPNFGSGNYVYGNLNLSGNIVPTSNVTYNLGSPTQRFASLYLSGNTIDLGGATIKSDATTGAIALIPTPTTANPNPTGMVLSPTGAVSTVATTGGVVSAGAIATSSNATATTGTTLANLTVTGNAVIQGNLQVTGNITTVNYETVLYTETANVITANSFIGNVHGAATGANLSLQSNGTTNATLDVNGNFGLGVTPSAWSGFKALQIGQNISLWTIPSGNGTSYYSNNLYFNGSNRIYINNGYATEFVQNNSGQHAWYTAPSGTAGGTVSLTQAMTLTNAGYLGIGTSSPSVPLTIATTGNYSGNALRVVATLSPTGYYTDLSLQNDGSVGSFINAGGSSNNYLSLQVQSTERMRIDSSGTLLIGTSSNPASSANIGLYTYGKDAIFGQNVDLAIGQSLLFNQYYNPNTYNAYALGTGYVGSINLDNSSGAIVFKNSSSSQTAGANVNSATTERMRINSSGNVLVGTTTANGSNFAVGTPFDTTSGSQTASFVGSKSGYAGYTMLPQGQLAVYDSSGTGVGAGGAISFMGYQSSSGTWYGSIQAYKANSTSTDYGAHMRFYTRPSGTVNTIPNLTLLNTLQTIVNGSGGYLGNSGLELQSGSMAVNSKGSSTSFASLQMLSGYVTAGSSGTNTTFCFISESHVANIRVMAVDNRGENYGCGSWIGVSNICYGGGNGPTATQTGFLSGSITGLTVQYNNSGYVLQAAVTYSGASSGVTIYFSVDANAAQSIYSS